MTSWAVAEAKAKSNDVVEQAKKNGPQQITKNGRPVAVVISMEAWKAEYGTDAPKGSMAEFFTTHPCAGPGSRLSVCDWIRGLWSFEVSARYQCDLATSEGPG